MTRAQRVVRAFYDNLQQGHIDQSELQIFTGMRHLRTMAKIIFDRGGMSISCAEYLVKNRVEHQTNVQEVKMVMDYIDEGLSSKGEIDTPLFVRLVDDIDMINTSLKTDDDVLRSLERLSIQHSSGWLVTSFA